MKKLILYVVLQITFSGVCSLQKRIYVAGGFTGQECLFSVEFLGTDCNQWTRVSPMRVPRSGVSVVPYRGLLVVIGGFDGHDRLSTIEVYHPGTSKWSTMPPMLTKRYFGIFLNKCIRFCPRLNF